MPKEKMPFKEFRNPPEVDPETGVVLTDEEARERREKRNNPMEEREQR